MQNVFISSFTLFIPLSHWFSLLLFLFSNPLYLYLQSLCTFFHKITFFFKFRTENVKFLINNWLPDQPEMDGYGLTLVPVWPQVCSSLGDSGSTKTVSVKMHELQELAEESRGIEAVGPFRPLFFLFYSPGTLFHVLFLKCAERLQFLSLARAAPFLECTVPGCWPKGLILNRQVSAKFPPLQKGLLRHRHLKWPPGLLFLPHPPIYFLHSTEHNYLLACICLINENGSFMRVRCLSCLIISFQCSSSIWRHE